MPPPALAVSISSLTTLLAQRLGINLSGNDFWGQPELDLYVRQAIREFQVLTGYWRGRVILPTVANNPFYDLHGGGTGVIPFTVQDTDILAQIGYQLLEFSGMQASFINTQQFALAAITAAFDQRREEILGSTRLIVLEAGIGGPPPPESRLVLPNTVIQLHRLEGFSVGSPSMPWSLNPIWSPSVYPWLNGGSWGLISRSDEMGGSGWAYGWSQAPGIPQGYSVALTRPFEIALIPGPLNNISLSLLITQSNPYTYTSGSPQLLGLPDDAAYALPWGILATVLNQDAQSRDYRRAAYAAQRYRAAMGVLKTWPCVMQGWPGGLQVELSSLYNLDHWQSGWRNATGALPTTVAMGGRNLVAFSPVPNAVYNIGLDCIVNSPASTTSRTATFDMPGDMIAGILDNAQHLATFKNNEFESTLDAYKGFISVAENYASREVAQEINYEALRGSVVIEQADRPYELAAVEA